MYIKRNTLNTVLSTTAGNGRILYKHNQCILLFIVRQNTSIKTTDTAAWPRPIFITQ